jgi:hypothetical protein
MASIPTPRQKVSPDRRIPPTALCKLFTFEQIRIVSKKAITLRTPVAGSMSAIGIFHQLRGCCPCRCGLLGLLVAKIG